MREHKLQGIRLNQKFGGTHCKIVDIPGEGACVNTVKHHRSNERVRPS